MINTIHLFPILDAKLIELLKSLTPEDWNKPTLAKQWTVKDIAAHLLDTNIRALALRDNYNAPPPAVDINSYNKLVSYLNDLNAEWVNALKRMSPGVLIELSEITGKEYTSYQATLDLYTEAPYSVAWAGEDSSVMWFHIAREYTEKWHHQQQIREAVGIPGIMTRELFYPCIDTFLCGLPYVYRDTIVAANTVIKIIIDTEIGGNWFLIYNGKTWHIDKSTQENITASVTIPPDIAWKLFTKGLTANEAKQHVIFEGDEILAANALNLLAIMA